MSENNQLNEKQILDKLFSAAENIPEQTVTIKRIGLSFTLSAMKEDKIEKLEKQYTVTKHGPRGQQEKELDRNRYFRALIAEATIAIGGEPNVRWSHSSLLERYKASGAEQVLKKVLLSGEIVQLADVVFEISGHYDRAEEDTQIKNL